VSAVNAITVLTRAFEDASVRFEPDGADDRQLAVISWPAVPIELVRAAGLQPVVVRGRDASTRAADAHLHDGAFPNRIRQLVDGLLVGRSSRAACVVLPRASEADYKCYLYLRELARRGLLQPSLPILLFDLLQSTGSEVTAHNASCVRALFAALGAEGEASSIGRLIEEIGRVNSARVALRRLVAHRAGRLR
jgi:hypothetical protein